jgi:hypothetical protein
MLASEIGKCHLLSGRSALVNVNHRLEILAVFDSAMP